MKVPHRFEALDITSTTPDIPKMRRPKLCPSCGNLMGIVSWGWEIWAQPPRPFFVPSESSKLLTLLRKSLLEIDVIL